MVAMTILPLVICGVLAVAYFGVVAYVGRGPNKHSTRELRAK